MIRIIAPFSRIHCLLSVFILLLSPVATADTLILGGREILRNTISSEYLSFVIKNAHGVVEVRSADAGQPPSMVIDNREKSQQYVSISHIEDRYHVEVDYSSTTWRPDSATFSSPVGVDEPSLPARGGIVVTGVLKGGIRITGNTSAPPSRSSGADRPRPGVRIRLYLPPLLNHANYNLSLHSSMGIVVIEDISSTLNIVSTQGNISIKQHTGAVNIENPRGTTSINQQNGNVTFRKGHGQLHIHGMEGDIIDSD